MIFNRLMTTKIILVFFLLTIATQAGGDHDDGQLTSAQAWGFGILTGASLSIVGVLAAILIICLKRCISD